MIAGKFHNNSPYVPVMLMQGGATQTPFFILDTGFAGDLMITAKIAKELGVFQEGEASVALAGGSNVKIPYGFIDAIFEGQPIKVEVLIGEGMQLAGIGLLTKFGCKAIVDCKNRTVSVEEA